VSNIPTPFVGGTDSPRRGSDEEKGLQPPYAPGGEPIPEAEAAAPLTDEQTGLEEPIHVEVGDLDEEDLLPDMSTEGEDIAIEGAMYDLEWPEGPELASEFAEETVVTPVEDLPSTAEPAAEPAEVAGGAVEVPDFLLGPDIGEAELATEPVSGGPAVPKEELVEMALKLQEGTLGESIRALVSDLSIYKPEIAVPRAFAAGYLAARKEKE
jgi:hypothetical protein